MSSESVEHRGCEQRRVLCDGEVLVAEGESSDSVFVVARGVLEATVSSPAGAVRVAACGEGEVIGEMAALAGLRRSATLRAVGEAEVTVLDPTAFSAWLSSHPERAAEVVAEARRRLNRSLVAEMTVRVLGEAAHELVPEMLAAAEWVDIEAGTTLFHQGDPPDAAYFVLSGRLQVTHVADDGTVEVLGDVGRSEVVGELAIIQQGPRSATVTAMRDSTLARFPLDRFEQLLVSHPALMLMVVRRMVSRISGTGRRDVERRAARSVALVVLADLTADEVVEPMLAAVRRLGPSTSLGSAALDALLAQEGAAQSGATDLGDARVSQYLAELEAAHEHVVYVADRTLTPWSRRVVQGADTVVIVASAAPGPAEVANAEAFLDACTDTQVPRWLAMVDGAMASRPTAAATWPVRARFHEVHHLRRGRRDDLARLGRLSLGAGYGLVLGGGGARGFAHLGVLRAMREVGVPIDRVGGASMGSIFAALAGLFDDVDEMTALCERQFDRLLDYTVPVVSLLKAKRITANLAETLGGLDAEDLWTPFYCVSTNLTRSSLHVHRDGDLVTAVRASIAIPGVLPPVPFGEDLLVDGGVLDNVPADIMRLDRSIGTVIASDVAPPSGPGTRENYGMFLSGWQALRQFVGRRSSPYPGVGSVLVRTMITSSEGRRAVMRTDGTADLYLDLEMAGVGLLDFHAMAPVVERGYALARPRVAAWAAGRADLPRSDLADT